MISGTTLLENQNHIHGHASKTKELLIFEKVGKVERQKN
jgi:hypothetical protein